MDRDKVFISISRPPGTLICIHLVIHHLAATALYLRVRLYVCVRACCDPAAFVVGVYAVPKEFDTFSVFSFAFLGEY